jgi:hypothetical protein
LLNPLALHLNGYYGFLASYRTDDFSCYSYQGKINPENMLEHSMRLGFTFALTANRHDCHPKNRPDRECMVTGLHGFHAVDCLPKDQKSNAN